MAAPLLWGGAFGEVQVPMSPARQRAVRHLRTYASALMEGGEVDCPVQTISVHLLCGEGSLAPFWAELPPSLRTDMQVAAECLDLEADGAETTAALLLEMAAGRVEEAGR